MIQASGLLLLLVGGLAWHIAAAGGKDNTPTVQDVWTQAIAAMGGKDINGPSPSNPIGGDYGNYLVIS